MPNKIRRTFVLGAPKTRRDLALEGKRGDITGAFHPLGMIVDDFD